MYFTEKKTIEIQVDYQTDSSILLTMLAKECRNRGFKVVLSKNEFALSMPAKFTTHSGQNELEATRVFRRGKVKLVPLTGNRIGILFSVNLNYLLVISLVSGLIVGLIGAVFHQMEFNLNFILIIAAIISIMLVIGADTIRRGIKEILNKT